METTARLFDYTNFTAANAEHMTETVKFKVGEIYRGNFASSSTSWYYYKIVRRTEKTVWLQQIVNGENSGEVIRRKLHVGWKDSEIVHPSQAKFLRADRRWEDDR